MGMFSSSMLFLPVKKSLPINGPSPIKLQTVLLLYLLTVVCTARIVTSVHKSLWGILIEQQAFKKHSAAYSLNTNQNLAWLL